MRLVRLERGWPPREKSPAFFERLVRAVFRGSGGSNAAGDSTEHGILGLARRLDIGFLIARRGTGLWAVEHSMRNTSVLLQQ